MVLYSREVKVNFLTCETKMEEALLISQKLTHVYVLHNSEYNRYFYWISDNPGQFKYVVPTAHIICSRYYKEESFSLLGTYNQIESYSSK